MSEALNSVEPVKSVENIKIKYHQTLLDDFLHKSYNILVYTQLLHWSTKKFSTHKATDEYYSKLQEMMDQFIEVLLGKTNRAAKVNGIKIEIQDISEESFIQKVKEFNIFLSGLDNNSNFTNDFASIRDEILADMNNMLYLLTLK